MTAIVGVLNSQGIAIAADSAVTVTGNNGKKVYNRSNKIFTLSKFHPVGIAIYNNADFMGIPLETIIKMYRKNLKQKSYPTLAEYKLDFIKFLKSQVTNVGAEFKRNSFFSFCFESYTAVINESANLLKQCVAELDAANPAQKATIYGEVIDGAIAKHKAVIDGYDKGNYVTLTYQKYCEHYAAELDEILAYIQTEIQKTFDDVTLGDLHKEAIKEMLFSLINIEYIFERHSGLVFIGFGEKEIYPLSQLVLVGTSIANMPRVRILDVVEIQPGKSDSNIIPYAQGDVTTTVLTGVDPNYKNEVKNAIRQAFDTSSEQISAIINNNEQSAQIKAALDAISSEFIQKLEQYQTSKITGPLLEILAHMGKEDMSELAESLVNITSLKRKFTSSDSSDESVGGPVDVAIITKGDGFIWMKRKHYFDIENNKGFMEKYYNI